MATFSDGEDAMSSLSRPISPSALQFDTTDSMRLHLQTLLDNKEKQLQSAATLGHQLLAQRMELEERIRQLQELDLDVSGASSDDGHGGLDVSLRDRYRELAEAIKAWDTENEQLTTVFGGQKPTNGVHAPMARHAESSRNEHERTKSTAGGPSAAQSSRRAKNAAHRADDVEFAFEIGSGLLTEVRRLQSLLGERDKAIQDMKEEKDDLEKTVENLRGALRQQEQSADKFKEENWNLEVTLQELRTQMQDAQATAQRLESENKRLTRQLTQAREAVDQHKNEAERQQTAYEELKAKHETDVAQHRKHAASLQRDKSDLQQALDSMKVEMAKQQRRLPRFGSPLTPNAAMASEVVTPADQDDDDVFSTAGASTHNRKKMDNSGLFPPDGFDFEMDSPDPSPSRPFLAPNHPSNEIEALQQRLAHAQRQINTLKSTLQREKELRMDYRRKLEASPGFAIEEEEDEAEEEVTKPKARLTPYRSARGRGRGRGRGGLTLTQRLGLAAHSPASEYNDDVDSDASLAPPVPPLPAAFRPEDAKDFMDDMDEEPDLQASPSPNLQSNRTSVDGMDPAFANILRRSASAGSLQQSTSPLRQAVARTQRGGTLPRRSRGGAAYQEARPPSLVGQPEALAAELGFGMIGSPLIDDLKQEFAAIETAECAVQTDFEASPPPPPPPPIRVTPATIEMGVQAEPEPILPIPRIEVSMQTDEEPIALLADAEVQYEEVEPPIVPVFAAAEVQTVAPVVSHVEMQTLPEPVPFVPERVDMDIQTQEVPRPVSVAAQTQTMAMESSIGITGSTSRYLDISIGDSSGDTTIHAPLRPSPTLRDAPAYYDDEDDAETETGSVMGETTQTEEFTDARSTLMTPTESLSDYHSIMTVSDADFSDSGSDDESIKASRIHSRNGNFSAMSSTASIPLASPSYGLPPSPAPPKPQPTYDSVAIETEPIPETPRPVMVEIEVQVEPEPVPEPPKIVLVEAEIQVEPEPEPVPELVVPSEPQLVEPIAVTEPEPASNAEPKPELKEMSVQTDEWVPPAPPAPVPAPALAAAAVATSAQAPSLSSASVPSASTSTPITSPASTAAAPASAPSVPTVFRVGPSSQQFQFISPPSSAGPTTTSIPAVVAAPSPNTTIRDANATIIARPRTSHSDRRQSIESTLSSVMDDVISRSRTPSMLPNIDKSRPPMMVLPPPPRQPPPPNSMLPPPFIPEKRVSHDLPPPRPSSPPPPELIQRATTPSLGVPGRGTIGRSHGSMPPSQQGLRQLPSTSSFRSAANAASRAPLSSPSALSFNLRDRERRELSSASLHSGGQSIGSQRSSISSEHHMYEHMRRHSNLEAMNGAERPNQAATAGSTDPTIIHAITQTMIGEFLYKYTRRTIGKGHGERRHKRFFWVHPYTRTLYWSSADPGASNVTESSAKSAYIESVRAVMDPNPMPPGIYQYSVVVTTPHREMKFTAPTKERHDIWFNALTYLLTRPGGQMQPSGNQGPAPPMSPMSANGDLPDEDQPYQPHMVSSPESQRSTRTGRTALSGESWNVTPRGQRSRSQISLGGSMGKRSGTPAAEYLRWAHQETPSSPSKEYEHIPGGPDAEDLDFELHDDTLSDGGYEGLENVRACCDGRHTVGRSGRGGHHHHHHHHHDHPPKREPSRAREQLLDPNPIEMQRPVSPAWSFRSRAGSATSHDGGGFFSRFGSRRSTKTAAGTSDS
ncbi:hypothetical protein BN946_scf185006.g14 [Trametes cinnabarina]|uniref:PH domain-containing protein n=1 Tax=Pycnoporus cinnabarinus TaxID=5643 RepID=A0A060SQW1_PYCCI|nr:hypothetical protein BN946_scf185006.g14 [Trametes cinnabarina]